MKKTIKCEHCGKEANPAYHAPCPDMKKPESPTKKAPSKSVKAVKAKEEKIPDVKVEKVGTGITERTQITGSNDKYFSLIEDMESRLEQRRGPEYIPNFFDYDTIDFLDHAEKILEAAAGNGKTGEWEPDSPEDFARRTISTIGEANYQIIKGDAAKAAYHAFRLGTIVEAARIKEIWEKPALFGKKRLEDQARFAKIGTDARRNSVASRREAWLKSAKALRQKHRDWSSRNIAVEVCKQFNLPAQSLQNVYKFLLRKSV